MKYISVEEAAQNWQLSERSVRNYCSQGRVEGALLEGKTWKIPSTAEKPERKTRHSSLEETLRILKKKINMNITIINTHQNKKIK